MDRCGLLALVEEVSRLERAAEAAAYLVDHLPGMIPRGSDYWRRQVGQTIGLLTTTLYLLRARLEELGYE